MGKLLLFHSFSSTKRIAKIIFRNVTFDNNTKRGRRRRFQRGDRLWNVPSVSFCSSSRLDALGQLLHCACAQRWKSYSSPKLCYSLSSHSVKQCIVFFVSTAQKSLHAGGKKLFGWFKIVVFVLFEQSHKMPSTKNNTNDICKFILFDCNHFRPIICIGALKLPKFGYHNLGLRFCQSGPSGFRCGGVFLRTAIQIQLQEWWRRRTPAFWKVRPLLFVHTHPNPHPNARRDWSLDKAGFPQPITPPPKCPCAGRPLPGAEGGFFLDLFGFPIWTLRFWVNTVKSLLIGSKEGTWGNVSFRFGAENQRRSGFTKRFWTIRVFWMPFFESMFCFLFKTAEFPNVTMSSYLPIGAPFYSVVVFKPRGWPLL